MGMNVCITEFTDGIQFYLTKAMIAKIQECIAWCIHHSSERSEDNFIEVIMIIEEG